MGKGLFAWITPVWSTSERDLVALVGLDATVFMRFTRMCRNIFLALSVLACCILIPVNFTKTTVFADDSWLNQITPLNVWGEAHWALVAVAWISNLVVCGFLWWNYKKIFALRRHYFESAEYQQSLHARTLMVSPVDLSLFPVHLLFLAPSCSLSDLPPFPLPPLPPPFLPFLSHRRVQPSNSHFQSLIQLYDIPKKFGSDEGISRIIDEVAPHSSFSRTAIARDVKILPELIHEHEKCVRKLEKVLAKHLKDPKNIPAHRPQCEVSKRDPSYGTYPKGQKVDAIDYLTQRIKELEVEIREVRRSVDKRSSMTYGFASYSDISEAHSIAYTARRKKPQGATITLAPRPHDIIWDNMPLSAATRARRRLLNNLWITLLTLIWVAPNAMIAIFLVNLSNLGKVWPAFQTSLEASTTFWSIVQGIASPAVTSLVYLLLPIAFRRMSIRAGDQTKTGRERHVTAKLYSFFVFNNLVVFSIFSSIWGFTAGVVSETQTGMDAWQAIVKENFGQTIFISLCGISTFWVTWLLQRQLGAAIDLAQLWTLFYSFVMRKFSSPTPRELIELTAPPPFDYASYYNYFLFYSTVALCYATIQPLVLPAAALYFSIDVALKKYLLLYVFVTKTESGGMFWRVLFNRFLFGTFLSNLIMFLVAWVRGEGTHIQAFAIVPLPFLLIGFKFYCRSAFDHKLRYYSTRHVSTHPEAALNVKESSRNDRLASRFGHPALYKPLITPMVHARAQNILASVYQGRLTDGREAGSGDTFSVSGYSDTYALNPMDAGKPGKSSYGIPGFEVVPESRLDFEYYKNRDEFAADHGGGELFGRPSDLVRPGTPGTTFSGSSDSRPGTPVGGMGFVGQRRAYSPGPSEGGFSKSDGGYGYVSPAQQQAHPGHSVYSSPTLMATDLPPPRSRSPMYNLGANESGSNLVQSAAGMPMSSPAVSPPATRNPSGYHSPQDSHGGYGTPGNPRAPGMLGGGPQGYGGLPQTDEDFQTTPLEVDVAQATQYDYFRGNNRRASRDPGTPGASRRPGAPSNLRGGSGAWSGN